MPFFDMAVPVARFSLCQAVLHENLVHFRVETSHLLSLLLGCPTLHNIHDGSAPLRLRYLICRIFRPANRVRFRQGAAFHSIPIPSVTALL